MRQIQEEATTKTLGNVLENPGLLSAAKAELERKQKADQQ
jgi:hypothetical protein